MKASYMEVSGTVLQKYNALLIRRYNYLCGDAHFVTAYLASHYCAHSY